MPEAVASEVSLDGSTSENDVAAYIDWIRQHPELRGKLVELLPQGHPLYEGRGTNQVVRIRGYLLASFEIVGLPPSAIVYVLEALQNSQNAYLSAAAAKALRGSAEPSDEMAAYLLRAITNIQYRDDALSFESYEASWPLSHYTTALAEILRTLELLGAHAQSALERLETMRTSSIYSKAIHSRAEEVIRAIQSAEPAASVSPCCAPTGKCGESGRERPRDVSSVADVSFQDQDGRTATYAQIFHGKPSVVAFFYTRCENPNKCSLTVTKLGQLQDELAARAQSASVLVAAVTYDPGHDTPERLRGYCLNRGFAFDEDNLALRADGRSTEIREFFELGVSYAGSVVSRHDVELYVLNEAGEIVTVYSNLQWDVDDVADEVTALLAAP